MSRQEQWTVLLEGRSAVDDAGARLGLSVDHAALLREFHQASMALLEARRLHRQQARRRAMVRTGAAVCTVLAVMGVWKASTALAQVSCAQTLPMPLRTLCADDPAKADDLNANFSTLANTLINRTGALGGNDLTVSGTLGFGSQHRQMINLFATSTAIGSQPNTLYQRSSTNFAWYLGGTHSPTALDPGAGGTLQMSLDGNGALTTRSGLNPGGRIVGTNGLQLRNAGDTALTSGADATPETYRLTTFPSGVTCTAADRGIIFVARPSAQNDQDSLCYCGNQAGNYEVWCFNP